MEAQRSIDAAHVHRGKNRTLSTATSARQALLFSNDEYYYTCKTSEKSARGHMLKYKYGNREGYRMYVLPATTAQSLWPSRPVFWPPSFAYLQSGHLAIQSVMFEEYNFSSNYAFSPLTYKLQGVSSAILKLVTLMLDCPLEPGDPMTQRTALGILTSWGKKPRKDLKSRLVLGERTESLYDAYVRRKHSKRLPASQSITCHSVHHHGSRTTASGALGRFAKMELPGSKLTSKMLYSRTAGSTLKAAKVLFCDSCVTTNMLRPLMRRPSTMLTMKIVLDRTKAGLVSARVSKHLAEFQRSTCLLQCVGALIALPNVKSRNELWEPLGLKELASAFRCGATFAIMEAAVSPRDRHTNILIASAFLETPWVAQAYVWMYQEIIKHGRTADQVLAVALRFGERGYANLPVRDTVIPLAAYGETPVGTPANPWPVSMLQNFKISGRCAQFFIAGIVRSPKSRLQHMDIVNREVIEVLAAVKRGKWSIAIKLWPGVPRQYNLGRMQSCPPGVRRMSFSPFVEPAPRDLGFMLRHTKKTSSTIERDPMTADPIMEHGEYLTFGILYKAMLACADVANRLGTPDKFVPLTIYGVPMKAINGDCAKSFRVGRDRNCQLLYGGAFLDLIHLWRTQKPVNMSVEFQHFDAAEYTSPDDSRLSELVKAEYLDVYQYMHDQEDPRNTGKGGHEFKAASLYANLDVS